MSVYTKNKEKAANSRRQKHRQAIRFLCKEAEDKKTEKPMARKASLLTEIRKDKILAIKRRIDVDKYDIDERLKVALDRLIEELLCQKRK